MRHPEFINFGMRKRELYVEKHLEDVGQVQCGAVQFRGVGLAVPGSLLTEPNVQKGLEQNPVDSSQNWAL